MNEKKIADIYEKEFFFKEQFRVETDEFIYYDISQDIMHAYKRVSDDEWKQVFVMTDCYGRWLEFIHPADGHLVERFLENLRNGKMESDMVSRFDINGQYAWFYTCLVKVETANEKENYALGYRRDLLLSSDGTNVELKDVLDGRTKVYTQKAFQKKFEDNIWKYRNQRGLLTILDINHFHLINEKHGYRVGNQLLGDLISVIRNNVSTDTMIGRMGGDVFLIYMNDVVSGGNWTQSIANILYQTKRSYGNHYLYEQVTISAGAAIYPRDGKSFEELYEKAKEAWTYSKMVNESQLEIYEEGMLRNKWGKDVWNADKCTIVNDTVHDVLEESMIPAMTRDLFAGPSDYGKSISILIKRMCERYEMSAVRIYEYLKESKQFCCTYEWSMPQYIKQIMEIVSISEDNIGSKIARIKREGTVHIYTDEMFVREYGNTEHESLPKVEDGVVVELLHKGQYLGRITLLDFAYSHQWTRQDMFELEWIGKLVAVVLYHGIRERIGQWEWNGKEKNVFDSLTGLYHMDAFLEKTQIAIDENSDGNYLIVYSDINNFKYVNETFGYDIGDNLLRSWAELLRKEVPYVLFAGRDGVDRFISLRKIPDNLSDTEIVELLNEAKSMQEQRIKNLYPGSNFTINMGAFCLKDNAPDLCAAVSYANMARKIARRNSLGCRLYTDTMRKTANRELELLSRLDAAIKQREFQVYLQPKISCQSQKVVGAEALVRWLPQDGQMIFPDEFISVFEKYGCIVSMDYYVYEEIFCLIRKWMDLGKEIIPISLNVSRAHLRDTTLIDKIESLMQIYKIPIQAIEFEITESLYMEQLPGLDAVLAYFQEKGFVVSMDDFGTGYSSLNAISTMPVDVIKMDKIFMKNDGLRKNDKIIISHIITMANELEKRVLCEGVETDEQKNFISSVGCDSWQGYLFSKPLPIQSFEELLSHSQVQPINDKNKRNDFSLW